MTDVSNTAQPSLSLLGEDSFAPEARYTFRDVEQPGFLDETPQDFLPVAQPAVLPMTREEMHGLGWDALDILLVSGDAYIDHPSFGAALLGRYLLAQGFRVGIIAQPLWENRAESVVTLQQMGRPRLFTGVTAGAIDSMLAHYTAFRKKRHDDAYTPGGQAGARPNRACIVYTGLVRQAFPHMPVVLGGIEASLRKNVHYDFWLNAIRRPLLGDSKADILIYGMGEKPLGAIAHRAKILRAALVGEGETLPAAPCGAMTGLCSAEKGPVVPGPEFRQELVLACRNVSGVVLGCSQTKQGVFEEVYTRNAIPLEDLPDYTTILREPVQLMKATLAVERHAHVQRLGCHTSSTATIPPYVLRQQVDQQVFFTTPPSSLLTENELDALYALPFSRQPHPHYQASIPAWEMIRTSITTHRGCGGGCSFCSLALHQGRRIASRSKGSILAEAISISQGPQPVVPGTLAKGGGRADQVLKAPRWAGAISDVGGPSANMWQGKCTSLVECRRTSCLHPKPCPHFLVNQDEGVALLHAVQALPGVNHVRIASGVRFDLALQNKKALVAYTSQFTGGQLKVAPEHCSPDLLALMRKPAGGVFEQFLQEFDAACGVAGKEQYTVAYLMSAFPGCTKQHMQQLRSWLREKGWNPQQVQCFIPTPGTVATAMYHAGVDSDFNPIYVADSDKERMEQHHMIVTPFGDAARRKKPPHFLKSGHFKKEPAQGQSKEPVSRQGKDRKKGYSAGKRS